MATNQFISHSQLFCRCVEIAASAAVVYDWALTFGQEVELVWRQRWSIMTVLFLGMRYGGIPYIVYVRWLTICCCANKPSLMISVFILQSLPSVSVTDDVSNIMNITLCWMSAVVNAMLGVIMIARLHAMYQRSRKILVFLVVIFLALTIASTVIVVKQSSYISGEELVLSGTYQCIYQGSNRVQAAETWILGTIWEVLALCLAVWIVVKHFRELPRSSTRRTVGDCFTVLIKSHVVYFACFAAVSCFNLGSSSPAILDSSSVGTDIYYGALQIFSLVQMFVLGPRLILSVREYHAKLQVMTDYDTITNMTPIAFQENIYVSTGGRV
ncbi:uncharacterized protein EDB91DRAFT_1347029 [Suillus paluster]|uniref:uncharacterized protein n=1 Tax=Suillus paluster TaxID=48578 RepID=UPI001B873B75|nr:uncharacterized protein EDB91DRAFT_1347029 [Suillus paluster]KAG1740457.1 hypothetical protein EDB91DRAFT_1347029 [Suillus paluster]